jgi:hypothetical protein
MEQHWKQTQQDWAAAAAAAGAADGVQQQAEQGWMAAADAAAGSSRQRVDTTRQAVAVTPPLSPLAPAAAASSVGAGVVPCAAGQQLEPPQPPPQQQRQQQLPQQLSLPNWSDLPQAETALLAVLKVVGCAFERMRLLREGMQRPPAGALALHRFRADYQWLQMCLEHRKEAGAMLEFVKGLDQLVDSLQ